MKKSLLKKLSIISMLALSSIIVSCGGGNSNPPEPGVITATILPANEATNQSKNVEVSATFTGGAVVTPTTDNIILEECLDDKCTEVDDENLCTEIGFDSPIAVCVHANLKEVTWYKVTVIGVKGKEGQDVDTKTSTFKTGKFSLVTITLTPRNNATSQELNVTVKATATGGSIAETQTSARFDLLKNNTGTTKCTGINLNSTRTVATCLHNDLEINSNYTLTASGILDSEGYVIDAATSTFTTISPTPVEVEDMTKTSITTVDPGSKSVTFTFTFSDPVIYEDSPTVKSVSSGTTIDEVPCTLDGGKTTCEATLTGFRGCDIFQDYEITLTGTAIETYSYVMNSADDEFDDATTFTAVENCYDSVVGVDYATIDGSSLDLLLVEKTGGDDIRFQLVKQSGSDLAFTVRVLSNDTGGETPTGTRLISINAGLVNDGSKRVDFSGGWLIENIPEPPVVITENNMFVLNSQTGGMPDSGGQFNPEQTNMPEYICITRVDDIVRIYKSTDDGISFTQILAGNLKLIVEGEPPLVPLPDSTNFDVSAWDPGLRQNMEITNASGEPYESSFDYLRFRSEDLGGSAEDCPKLK